MALSCHTTRRGPSLLLPHVAGNKGNSPCLWFQPGQALRPLRVLGFTLVPSRGVVLGLDWIEGPFRQDFPCYQRHRVHSTACYPTSRTPCSPLQCWTGWPSAAPLPRPCCAEACSLRCKPCPSPGAQQLAASSAPAMHTQHTRAGLGGVSGRTYASNQLSVSGVISTSQVQGNIFSA